MFIKFAAVLVTSALFAVNVSAAVLYEFVSKYTDSTIIYSDFFSAPYGSTFIKSYGTARDSDHYDYSYAPGQLSYIIGNTCILSGFKVCRPIYFYTEYDPVKNNFGQEAEFPLFSYVQYGNYVSNEGDVLLSISKVDLVTEPTTWAMLVIGFGAIGLGVRRIRSRRPFLTVT